MKYKSIGVSGDPRAGKSALIARLREVFPYQVVDNLFRKKHKDWQSQDPSRAEIDLPTYYRNRQYLPLSEIREINGELESMLVKGRVIVDSRFIPKNALGTPTATAFLTASLEERSRRNVQAYKLQGRIISIEDSTKELVMRGEDEVECGHEIYGPDFDYRDNNLYHLILETDKMTIDEELDAIKRMMSVKTIAISGKPGAGSTATTLLLAKKLGFKCYEPGDLFKAVGGVKSLPDLGYEETFRKLCKQEGLVLPELHSSTSSTAALSVWRTQLGRDPRFHRILDDYLPKKLAAKDNLVNGGKLSIHMNPFADFKIWLNAAEPQRAERTARKDGIEPSRAISHLREREEVERREWKLKYGFDYFTQRDESDLLIDSTHISEEKVVEIIYRRLKTEGIVQ